MSVFDELFIKLIEYRPKRFIPNISSKWTSLKDRLRTNNNQGEYETIKKAFEASGFCKAKAAKLLGINRTTLWKKLKQINSQPITE